MIRRAGPDDLAVVRTVRLQALADAPDAFDSTLERETDFSDQVWLDRLRSDRAVTMLDVDGSSGDAPPAGLAVGALDDDDRAVAHLYSMWVRPEERGTGAADRLVTAVLGWARAVGRRIVRLHVTEGNEPAMRLYARHGFEATGRSITRGRDGRVEHELEIVLAGDDAGLG